MLNEFGIVHTYKLAALNNVLWDSVQQCIDTTITPSSCPGGKPVPYLPLASLVAGGASGQVTTNSIRTMEGEH